MVGIVEFLNARLNEDVVIAFMGEEWSAEDWETAAGSGIAATHIARHDPARVLREVTAKRKIIVELESLRFSIDSGANRGTDNPEGEAYVNGCLAELERTVRALAAVYADHPDYDHSWV